LDKAKLYKLINRAIGFVFALLGIVYLLFLFREKTLIVSWDVLRTALERSPGAILLTVVLMPLNWFIEMEKWGNLAQSVQTLRVREVVYSILIGTFASIITPNRLGELGGRLYYIKKGNRLSILYINFMCSLSQMVITFLLGGIAIFYLYDYLDKYLFVSRTIYIGLALLAMIFTLVAYLRSKLLMKLLSFFGSSGRMAHSKVIGTGKRLELLLKSGVRYAVFSAQFILLLQVFDPSIHFLKAGAMTSFIFLGTSLLPLGWISSLAVRASFAYFTLDLVGFDGSVGLMSSVILWIINLFIPALIGLFLIRSPKIFSNSFTAK
jgi:uncharacterized membrane protein YbhN (UPF0104 family)